MSYIWSLPRSYLLAPLYFYASRFFLISLSSTLDYWRWYSTFARSFCLFVFINPLTKYRICSFFYSKPIRRAFYSIYYLSYSLQYGWDRSDYSYSLQLSYLVILCCDRVFSFGLENKLSYIVLKIGQSKFAIMNLSCFLSTPDANYTFSAS